MQRLPHPARGAPITVDFEGDAVPAFEGEPVACSLLAAGESTFSRSVKYHRPRGPYCFAAGCSHCLMRVDGVPNVFTCRTPARAGMRLERQNAYPSAKVDVFRSIDWLFPRGLDHHEMFAGVPVAEQVMAKVARHLAGLGLLPEQPAPQRRPAEVVECPVAIVGAGPAGLAAAEALAARGVRFVLLERDGWLGGRLVGGPPEAGAAAVPEASAFPEGSVRLHTLATGFYDDARGRFVSAVQALPSPRLLLVYARQFLFAAGGSAALPPFENNDLPGIFSGRAASLLVRKWGLLPGPTVVCAGVGRELEGTAALLSGAGARVALSLDLSAATLVRAHGRKAIRAISYREGRSRERRVSCDALVLAMPPAPSDELPKQGGAQTTFDPRCGFPVQADASGRTAAPDVHVAGEICGPCTAVEAAEAGRRAAASIRESLP